MNTIIKAVLIAASIVALVWPLLFWGELGPENRDHYRRGHPASQAAAGHLQNEVSRSTNGSARTLSQ
jgi:hypothetical protein